jgi:hypothetical protein
MSADRSVIGPIQGKGADIVPPSLDQARVFARHSKSGEHPPRLSGGLAGFLRLV